MTHATSFAARTLRIARSFVAAPLIALALLLAMASAVAADEWWLDDGLGQPRSAISYGVQPDDLVGVLPADVSPDCGLSGTFASQGAARHAC